MSEQTTQIKVGVTAVIALCILIFGIIWGKEFRFAQEFTVFKIHFDNVYGLESGDPVLWSGINCGEVIDIQFNPSEARGAIVTVRLSIKKPVLYSDYVITIEDAGLMGDKMVTIDQGSKGNPIEIMEKLSGVEPSGLQQLTKDAKIVIRNVNKLLDQISTSISELDMTEFSRSLKKSVEDLGSTAKELRDLIESNKPGINDAVMNFGESSKRFKGIIEKNDQSISRIIQNADSLTAKLDRILTHVDSSTAVFDTLKTYIENRDGTIRKLFFSDSLYYEFRAMNRNLDSLITRARKGDLNLKLDWW